jgi:hypothetical protein
MLRKLVQYLENGKHSRVGVRLKIGRVSKISSERFRISHVVEMLRKHAPTKLKPYPIVLVVVAYTNCADKSPREPR